MAADEQHPSSHSLRAPDEVDELFATANPNPERIGCPGQEALRALARKKRPIGDPQWEHLTKCSPCYVEFREIQKQTSVGQRARLARLAALAAVAAALLVGAFWLRRERTPEVAEAPQQVASAVEFDLRAFAVTRSETNQEGPAGIRLPRSALLAEFVLPVGSDTGPYQVRLLDDALQARAMASGEAVRQNGQTRLRATLDLRKLAPGGYQLGLRREGEGWRMYPARVE